MNVYYIGGSPCSGKSTVAEALCARYGLRYFKVDDHLERYMQLAAQHGKPSCLKVADMTPDQIWMREPQVQCDEEVLIYREIFEYALADLRQLESAKGILAEGAAFLPELARLLNVPDGRYVAITPTKEFQLFHYGKREWVPYVLEGCGDKAQAFANWMERDALFAKAIQQQCAGLGYASLINGGEDSVESMIARVAAHFGLE